MHSVIDTASYGTSFGVEALRRVRYRACPVPRSSWPRIKRPWRASRARWRLVPDVQAGHRERRGHWLLHFERISGNVRGKQEAVPQHTRMLPQYAWQQASPFVGARAYRQAARKTETARARQLAIYAPRTAGFRGSEGIHQGESCEGNRRPAKTIGHRPWTEDEITRYEARHPIGSKARLAFALPLYTALRKSDFLRVGPQHIRDGVLHVTQQKTGGALRLPIRSELQEIIAATPCDHMTFLVSATGGPYSPNGFAEQFRRWCDEAGLPKDCKVHGLRGTCATRLAHRGATPHEIQAWTGHRSLAQVQHYTRAADQLRLARDAIEQSDNKGVTNLRRKSD